MALFDIFARADAHDSGDVRAYQICGYPSLWARAVLTEALVCVPPYDIRALG